MAARKVGKKVRRWRVGPLPILVFAFVVILLGALAAFFRGRACVAETNSMVADIARLEDEISFRRRSLRQALDKAETVQEIRGAQAFLTAQSLALSAALQGRKLDDLGRDLDRLTDRLDVVLPDVAPSPPMQPDAWLRANYPVDVQGFLYSVSLSELSAARLAAADQERVFAARRRIPANSTLRLTPDCSFASAVRHAIAGYRRVIVSSLPPTRNVAGP